MPEIAIRVAARYLRRQFEKGIGRSIAKILTEIVTNSDDSYKVLEASGAALQAAPITIRLDRPARRFIVVDQAEGLTEQDMEQHFATYGLDSGDRHKKAKTRSLFGKGLRDVLFTQRKGIVYSIKDGHSATCSFRWKSKGSEEHAVVDLRTGPKVTKSLRAAWDIPGNGTRVEFVLREDLNLPQHDSLVERLTNFYMLRLINSDPKRLLQVETIYRKSKRTEQTEIHYAFPTGASLAKTSFELVYTGYSVKAELDLRQHERDLSQGEAGYETRDGGLLIVDEDGAVLDLTLFPRYDEDPAASRLFGILRLTGVGKLIRDHLNQAEPEEILTETRDGFDRKHPFFKALASKVEPVLNPFVEAERKTRQKDQRQLPEEVAKRHKQAFERLNELNRRLVGPAPGSTATGGEHKTPDVMAFMWSAITVKAGHVQHDPLMVNIAKVADGSVISIGSSDDKVRVEPIEITVDQRLARAGVFVRAVGISGDRAGVVASIRARAPEGTEAQVVVNVVREEAYLPGTGIGFFPEAAHVHPGERRQLNLWVDLKKLPLGSRIVFESTEKGVLVDTPEIELAPEHKFDENVARVRALVRGVQLGADAVITATSGSLPPAEAYVEVSRKRDIDPGSEGRFKNYRFAPSERKTPSMIDAEGYVTINTRDEVNVHYFGDDPYGALEQSPAAQARLADLILDECLNEIVVKALEQNALERKWPNNLELDVRNYVQEQKFLVGPEIHRFFTSNGASRSALLAAPSTSLLDEPTGKHPAG